MSHGMDYQGESSPGGFGNPGFGMDSSPGPDSKWNKRKNYDEHTIHPCTVSMILCAKAEHGVENSFELADGRNVHHIALVGAIKKHYVASTNIIYEIEDGTGLIEVKQWVDPNDCAAKRETRELCMKDDIYVKVVMLLSLYDEKVVATAQSIRPIVSGNELSCHLLDVIYAAEKQKNREIDVAKELFMHENVSLQKAEGIDIKDAVAHFIQVEGDRNDVGAHVSQCVIQLGVTYGEEAVRRVVEQLAVDGVIYTTATEECYKLAMNL